AAAARTRNGRVGVIGTEATIASGAYTTALRAVKPGLEIYTRPCPLLVALAEEGWVEGPIPQSVVETYLATLRKSGIDTLVLGCTHYPLLKAVIAGVMGERVALVDSAEETARAVAALLAARGRARRPGAGSTMTGSLPPAMIEEVERVRKAEHRTRSELVREALRTYFGAGRGYLPTLAERRAIERGRAEIRRGEYLTLEELRAHVGAVGRKARRKSRRSRFKARA